MDERYIAAVDLGSFKIALAVAKVEGEDVEIIYYDEVHSEGVRYSCVFNPQKVSEPLRNLIRKAEKDLGIDILQVVVGLPRYAVKQQVATGEIPRSDASSCISAEEVYDLKNMALDSYPLDDAEKEIIYGAVAQSFTTDDYHQATESDVIGMISDRLEGNFKVFIGNRKNVSNLDKVFNDINVAIANKYFVPEVMSKVILTREEMENGVALIDFGAGVTSVSIYQNGIMRHYSSIPFGGSTVTNDIKLEGGFSTSLAENIKLAYGACMPDKLASMSEKIIKVCYKDSGREKDLRVRYLSEIITSREKEIIDAILYEIQKSGFADYLRSGLVITGGGAEMVNLGNFISDLSGYNVRIGYPGKMFSTTGCQKATETSAASCLSMILAAKYETFNCVTRLEQEDEEQEEDEEVLELTSPVFSKKDKPEKREKKKKESKKVWKTGIWTKTADLFNGLFDATTGAGVESDVENNENNVGNEQ